MTNLYRLVLSLIVLCCSLVYADESAWQLKIGFDAATAPDIDKSDIQVSMQFWVEEIGQQADLPIVVKIYQKNVEQMVNDFNNGRINFLFTTPLNFIKLFERDLLADGFTGSVVNNSNNALLVLTHKASGSDQFAALRGKRVTLLQGSEIHKVYLETLCRETFQQACSKALKILKPAKTSARQILDLFFGRTDVVVVYDVSLNLMSELNPQVRRELQVLQQYPGIVPAIGFFHTLVPQVFRDRVIEVAEQLDQYNRGSAILQIFRNDR